MPMTLSERLEIQSAIEGERRMRDNDRSAVRDSPLVIPPQHKPGPWIALPPASWAGDSQWIVPGVAHCGSGELSEANARLIAAAPDMYDALKQAAELLGLLARPDGRPESISHIWARCVEIDAKARAALDKANTTTVKAGERT